MIGTIIKRGVIAGAVGTTALNAVTYLDMAVRGRPASKAPEEIVGAIAGAVGVTSLGEKERGRSRRTALGALSGIGTGLAVGVVASTARAVGFAPPASVGAVATGAAAMAASDVPMAALGVSDPRRWTSAAWVSDIVPHLVFGAAVRAVVHAHPTEAERADSVYPRSRASTALLLRSAAIGVASGSRSSFGVAGPVLSSAGAGRVARTAAVLGAGTELVLDKLPSTPSRLEPPVVASRLASGAGGAVALAHREHTEPTLPAVVGAAGAALGTWAGAAWRSWAVGKLPSWQAAVLEDAAALSLVTVACRR